MFCPNCGSPVADSANFCAACAHPLKVNEAPAPAVETALVGTPAPVEVPVVAESVSAPAPAADPASVPVAQHIPQTPCAEQPQYVPATPVVPAPVAPAAQVQFVPQPIPVTVQKPASAGAGRVFGILGMILALVSCLFLILSAALAWASDEILSACTSIGINASIIGFVFSIVGKRVSSRRGFSCATGVVGIVFSSISLAVWLLLMIIGFGIIGAAIGGANGIEDFLEGIDGIEDAIGDYI